MENQKPIVININGNRFNFIKGDTVLDPFTGSSTTGLAAFSNDRNFIGIDTENKYLDLSIKRFEELTQNNKLKF